MKRTRPTSGRPAIWGGTILGSILRILEWCARQGSTLLVCGILIGLFVPPLAAAMREVLTPCVFLLMLLALLRVDPSRALSYLRRPLLVAALCAWLLLACPMIAFAIAWTTGLTTGEAASFGAALVIMATGCAATSSPAFARLVGLDGELSLVVALFTTLLVPFTAPPLALGLLGIDLSISIPALMARLALLVGLPLILSLILRHRLGTDRLERAGGAVDGSVVLLVVIYGFGVMDGILDRLLAEPLMMAAGTALAFAGSLGLNALTALAFRPAGAGPALTAGLLSGNRNMSLYLAVLPAATDARILLFFALCQFPLFFSPLLLKPLYRRLHRQG
ncbi:hypothetical protein ACFOD4_15115 [Pseudoroseomonas globiformis]|uniref:Bile acid:sodium symporter n=1 Tax=Teichococcus globiformis TaxID=2307229 RepID=A0ABV7G138_9PROT